MADELVNGSVTTVRPPSPQPTRRNLLSLETMKVNTGCIKLFVEIFILFIIAMNGKSLTTIYPFSVPYISFS